MTTSKKFERARIVAAFMGLLVEQSIKKIDFGQIATAADVSPAQMRDELSSTIAVLAAHVEQMDRRVLAGESAEIVECAHGLAMLLCSVLRTWLDGEEPELTRTISALKRAGAWEAPHELPQPGLAHEDLRLTLALEATAPRGRGRGTEGRCDLLQTRGTRVSRTRGKERGTVPLNRSPHEPSSYSAPIRSKRLFDTNQLGERIVDLSTSVAENNHPTQEFRVTEVVRKGSLKSGKTRTAALTPERQREIAQLAAQERWKSRKQE
jgi:hypothetical protein